MAVSRECSQSVVLIATLVALAGTCVFVFAIFAASPAERDAGTDNQWHVHYVIGLLLASGIVECLAGMIAPCVLSLLPVLVISFFLVAACAVELAVAISLFDANAANNFIKSASDVTQQYRVRLFYTRFGTLVKPDGSSLVGTLLIVCSILPMITLIISLLSRWKMNSKTLLKPPPKPYAASSPNSTQLSGTLQPITFPPTTPFQHASPPPPLYQMSPVGGGSGFGVGCYFHTESDGSMSVSKFVDGGPAQLCRKINIGDVLVAVNGVNVFRKAHSELAPMLKGPFATEVDLTFTRRRDEARYTVRLARLSDGSGRSPAPTLVKGGYIQSDLRMAHSPPPPPPPPHSETFTAGGQMVGVGMVLESDATGALCVSSMIPGGAAERSGQVNIGDRIIQVGGVPVRDEMLSSIQSRILGPPGTVVRVYLARDPNPQAFAVDLVRQGTGPQFMQDQQFPTFVQPVAPHQHIGGIGIVLSEALHGAVYVTAVVPGGPASLAGIEVGSCLYTVDGADVYKVPLEIVDRMIKGPLNSNVMLGFRKGGSDQISNISCLRTLPETSGSVRGGASSSDTVIVPVEELLHRQRSHSSTPSNQLYGVGIFFHPDGEGGQLVGRLVPGGPAELSNRIRVGDRLFYVDGQNVYGKTVQQLSKYLLGRRGSFVRLGFKRDKSGRFVEVTLQRGSSAGDRSAGKIQMSPRNMATSLSHSPTLPNYRQNLEEENVYPRLAHGGEVVGDPVGIGMQVTPAADGTLTVSAVQPGGGAWRSEAIEVGDTLIAVDRSDVFGTTPAHVASLLMGAPGSTVTLSVRKRTTSRLTDVLVVRGWWS